MRVELLLMAALACLIPACDAQNIYEVTNPCDHALEVDAQAPDHPKDRLFSAKTIRPGGTRTLFTNVGGSEDTVRLGVRRPSGPVFYEVPTEGEDPQRASVPEAACRPRSP